MTDYVHTCRPDRPAGAAAPRRAGEGGRLTIDMHCHLLTAAVDRLAAGHPRRPQADRPVDADEAASAAHNRELARTVYAPKLTDLNERLADMDAMGVDIQAVSPSPTQYYYWADRDLAVEIVRGVNEHIAEIAASRPERFVGLGTVALQHPELAADQAEHAVRKLGLKGVEISTLIDGVDVGDPRFDPFWARIEALDAIVFLHPLGTSIGSRLNRFYLSNIVGNPAETAMALSHLIFGGAFDRYPGLKLIAAHGGGYLPPYIARSDHGYRVRPEAHGCAHPPSVYLKHIWFDTMVYDAGQLRRLIEVVGASQVVVGTDYPFDMGDYDPQALVDAVAGLSDADRNAILGANAAKLLGLPNREPPR
jgi:aminocarboxymuconate-semialdehyde decarboxylase